MKTISKADRFVKAITEMPFTDRKWLFGNETDNPLQFAFDAKRTVHPGVKGSIMSQNIIPSKWHDLMTHPCRRAKRVAYIHIPFCQTRCLYCGFFQNFSNKEIENAYIDRLIMELRMSAKAAFINSHPIHAVYLGGGTPSALSAKNIERLLYAIQLHLPLANDYELTFESRFHEFDDDKINACLNRGVNRFSFGVQSFDTKVRRCIGRIDDREKILDRLKYLMNLDNAAIVIDLMYGLPHQTMDVWEKDAQTLIDSEIDGGDLY